MAARTGDGPHPPYATTAEGLTAALKDHFTPALAAMREMATQGRITNRSATVQFDGATWTVNYRPDWRANRVAGYIVTVDQDLRGGYTTDDMVCAADTLTELGFEDVQRHGPKVTGSLPLEPFTLVD